MLRVITEILMRSFDFEEMYNCKVLPIGDFEKICFARGIKIRVIV